MYPALITSVLLSTIVARMLSVFIPISIMKMCSKDQKNQLKWNETVLVAIGGIIRGAIAFGLSLQIQTSHQNILKTTTQIVVLITTVLLGCSMGLIAKCLKVGSDNEGPL